MLINASAETLNYTFFGAFAYFMISSSILLVCFRSTRVAGGPFNLKIKRHARKRYLKVPLKRDKKIRRLRNRYIIFGCIAAFGFIAQFCITSLGYPIESIVVALIVFLLQCYANQFIIEVRNYWKNHDLEIPGVSLIPNWAFKLRLVIILTSDFSQLIIGVSYAVYFMNYVLPINFDRIQIFKNN